MSRRGGRAEAEAAYRRGFEIDPHSPEARVGLAWLSRRNGKRDDAFHDLRQAVKDEARNRLALREPATTLASDLARPTGAMWREAIPGRETLITLDRNDPDAHHDLAAPAACSSAGPPPNATTARASASARSRSTWDVGFYSVRLDLPNHWNNRPVPPGQKTKEGGQ